MSVSTLCLLKFTQFALAFGIILSVLHCTVRSHSLSTHPSPQKAVCQRRLLFSDCVHPHTSALYTQCTLVYTLCIPNMRFVSFKEVVKPVTSHTSHYYIHLLLRWLCARKFTPPPLTNYVLLAYSILNNCHFCFFFSLLLLLFYVQVSRVFSTHSVEFNITVNRRYNVTCFSEAQLISGYYNTTKTVIYVPFVPGKCFCPLILPFY